MALPTEEEALRMQENYERSCREREEEAARAQQWRESCRRRARGLDAGQRQWYWLGVLEAVSALWDRAKTQDALLELRAAMEAAWDDDARD